MTLALSIAPPGLPRTDPLVFTEITRPVSQRPAEGSVRFWSSRLAGYFAPSKIAIRSIAGGRPRAFIGGEPVSVSFSRTTGARVCAVGFSSPIGVDIERICDLPEIDEMISLSLAGVEADRCGSLSGPDRVRKFYECWTRKEAVLKAVGVGLGADPRRVVLGPLAGGVGVAVFDGHRFETRVVFRGDLVVSLALPVPI